MLLPWKCSIHEYCAVGEFHTYLKINFARFVIWTRVNKLYYIYNNKILNVTSCDNHLVKKNQYFYFYFLDSFFKFLLISNYHGESSESIQNRFQQPTYKELNYKYMIVWKKFSLPSVKSNPRPLVFTRVLKRNQSSPTYI